MIVSTGSTPSGSLFPQGEYRLLFTYRRDNVVVGPDEGDSNEDES
jgi:hypothetical protein